MTNIREHGMLELVGAFYRNGLPVLQCGIRHMLLYHRGYHEPHEEHDPQDEDREHHLPQGDVPIHEVQEDFRGLAILVPSIPTFVEWGDKDGLFGRF